MTMLMEPHDDQTGRHSRHRSSSAYGLLFPGGCVRELLNAASDSQTWLRSRQPMQTGQLPWWATSRFSVVNPFQFILAPRCQEHEKVTG